MGRIMLSRRLEGILTEEFVDSAWFLAPGTSGRDLRSAMHFKRVRRGCIDELARENPLWRDR